MRLSLVLPCLNEAQNIGGTLGRVQEWFRTRRIDGTIVVVNDGSTDATASILQGMQQSMRNLRVVTHEKNSGYGAAVVDGCDAAEGDIIGFMDSDGQFDPADFDRLLPLLERVPFVTGRRRHRADPFMRKFNAKLFGLLSFFILGIWVRDINCAMKLWRRDLWPVIRPRIATGALMNAEIFYRLRRAGKTYAQVDVRHFPRKFGVQTGAKLSVILRALRELFALRMKG